MMGVSPIGWVESTAADRAAADVRGEGTGRISYRLIIKIPTAYFTVGNGIVRY